MRSSLDVTYWRGCLLQVTGWIVVDRLNAAWYVMLPAGSWKLRLESWKQYRYQPCWYARTYALYKRSNVTNAEKKWSVAKCFGNTYVKLSITMYSRPLELALIRWQSVHRGWYSFFSNRYLIKLWVVSTATYIPNRSACRTKKMKKERHQTYDDSKLEDSWSTVKNLGNRKQVGCRNKCIIT